MCNLVAVAVLASCGPASTTPTFRPERVERTSLSDVSTSTGSVTAGSETNLGFGQGGQLTAVNVKVGDEVKAGEVLATIDDVPARQALAAQEAQLRAQRATLQTIESSPGIEGAEDGLDQAEDVLDAVRDQVSTQNSAGSAVVRSAQQQVIHDQQAASQAQSARDSACAMNSSSPSCMSARSAYQAALQRQSASQAALSAAVQKQRIEQAAGEVSIETARQAVVTARSTVELSKSDRPHLLNQQRAQVDMARAAVVQARHDLANTVLRAPADGTVTALNGAVGEYLTPSSGTGALAPGSTAALPGASGATSSGSPLQPSRPGGNQFLVLSEVDRLQIVVPFNEADAANVRPDESVRVTFDAIPDLTATGTVTSVAPAGFAVAGVISYYVTVDIDSDDPRLRSGQTANVSVETDERVDVLTVPNAAVRSVNGRSAVTVIDGENARTVPFEAGKVGAERTEVVSGLREGQRVVIPTSGAAR